MGSNEVATAAIYGDEERTPPGSFVAFPNQMITTLGGTEQLHHQSNKKSIPNKKNQQRVFVTVAVQPNSVVQPFGGFAQSYTPNQPAQSSTPAVVPVARSPAPTTPTAPPPPSQQQQQQQQAAAVPVSGENTYTWGPTHPINRASPATVKWLLDNFEQADGVSLPRARMYDHYLFHSQQNNQEPVNAASFGKLVRSVFTGLKTRRLGTRGNSKYHYYGIRIKDASPLHEIQRDPNFDQMVDKMTPKVTKEKPSRRPKETGNGHGSDEQQTRDSRKRLLEFVGDTTSALPDFPSASPGSLLLPDGVDEEDIELFEEAYRNHCEEIVETVVNLQFDDLQQLWYRWWQLASEELDGRSLAKDKMALIFSIDKIAEWIHECDTLLYASLAELLIPNVLRPDLPNTFVTHIREFAKLAESWMRQAVENTTESIQTAKLSSVVRFSSNLRQLTTLNHLANEFRKTFQQNDTICPILLRDLEKIDFVKIQDQVAWITNCPLENFQRVADGLKNLLSTRANVEQWMSFLQDALYHSLPEKSHSSYTQRAAELIMKWSYYSSMVMRDFTLRSSPQFGSLVIIRMFLDELVTHIIVNKLQKPFFQLKNIDIKSDSSYSPEPEPVSSGSYITLTSSSAPIMTTVSAPNQETIQFADQSAYAVSFSHE